MVEELDKMVSSQTRVIVSAIPNHVLRRPDLRGSEQPPSRKYLRVRAGLQTTLTHHDDNIQENRCYEAAKALLITCGDSEHSRTVGRLRH